MARSFFVRMLSLLCVTLFVSQQVAFAEVKDAPVCRADLRFSAADIFGFVDRAHERLESGDAKDKELRARLQKIGPDALIDKALSDSIKDLEFVGVDPAKIDDQKQSGDCWLIAITAWLADQLYTAGRVPKNFELSLTYVYFFTNVLKTDSYFNHIIDLATGSPKGDQPAQVGPALKEYLTLIADGGDESWTKEAIATFGVVPKHMMKPTFSAQDTEFILNDLQKYSGQFADKMLKRTAELRKQGASESDIFAELKAIKIEASTVINQVLQAHLGYPNGVPQVEGSEHPEKSVVRVAERINGEETGKMLEFKDGVDFAQNFIKYNPDDFITVAKIPTLAGHNYYHIPRSSIDDGFKGSRKYDINFLNVSTKRYLELIDKAILDHDIPVPFSSAVTTDVTSHGIGDPHVFLRNRAYGLGEDDVPPMSTAAGIEFGTINDDHEQAFIKVAHPGPDGKGFDRKHPLAAIVSRNSWGDHYGPARFRGDMVLSRSFVTDRAFTIVIPVHILSPEEQLLIRSPKRITSAAGQVFGPGGTGGGGDKTVAAPK